MSIVDVLRGFPEMEIGTPDPERRKRRKSFFSSHEQGFKMIQQAALCDYEVVYLLVDGLSPKRQVKVLTVTSEKSTPLLPPASSSSCGSHWEKFTVLLGESTLFPCPDVRLSSAVTSPSVEQEVPCSTLKQLFKADPFFFFFIWAVGFGVSSIVSVIVTVSIGRDTSTCSGLGFLDEWSLASLNKSKED
jgi:hypothetical protein